MVSETVRYFSLPQKYDRPFNSYKEQINKLRDRGMNIDSYLLAVEILKTHGYYNLINGYKDDFLVNQDSNDEDHYKPGTTLVDLVYEKRVETDLQNILFKYTLMAESRFKEAMAQTISREIGVSSDDYLNFKFYRNPPKAKNILNYIKKNYLNTKDNPTYYYSTNHNHVPAWILLDNVTLGSSRMWFSIFKKNMTHSVAKDILPIKNNIFEENTEHSQISPTDFLREFIMDEFTSEFPFEEWELKGFSSQKQDDLFEEQTNKYVNLLTELVRNIISIIYDFRNNMAHDGRLKLYSANQSLNIQGLYFFINNDVLTKHEYDSGLGKRDIFAFMISLVIILDSLNVQALFSDLEHWQKSNQNDLRMKETFLLYFNSLKLPTDFVSRLRKIDGKQLNENWILK